MRAERSTRNVLQLFAVTAAVIVPTVASARPFRIGPIDGIFDVTLAYGILARTQERDPNAVGIANGGSLPSVNVDDGNLNYDVGLVSNSVRGTGELALRWRDFGAVVRGFGFYDFQTMLTDRARTDLSDEAEDMVGRGGDLQEYYLTGRFTVGGMPVRLRLGNQVINWGESGFLRFGVDVINPVDLVALVSPTTTARDIFIPQGMLWGAASVTETLAVEFFYQYDWEPVRLYPVGSYLSADDLIGGDGTNFALEGFGEFSELGTNLDAAFGLPEGTLGFDPRFMRIPPAGKNEPSDRGQFGFTLQAFMPQLNFSKVALHFVNYHSRLLLISGITANQAAIDATSDAAVQERAEALAAQTGLPVTETRSIAETLTIGNFAKKTRYVASYPENVQMLGLSFNTATIRTGTLVAGEVSHHFGWPVQIPKEEIILASLSPIQFTDTFAQTSLGRYGANELLRGFVETGKTQLSLGMGQLFGRRLGAAQSLLTLDIGWVHVNDLPRAHVADADSWGYRLTGQLTYDGVFGGLTVMPRVLWSHDGGGDTPPPAPAFIEGRKSVTAAVGFEYASTFTADVGYTAFFDGEPFNILRDRDFVRFNVMMHY